MGTGWGKGSSHWEAVEFEEGRAKKGDHFFLFSPIYVHRVVLFMLHPCVATCCHLVFGECLDGWTPLTKHVLSILLDKGTTVQVHSGCTHVGPLVMSILRCICFLLYIYVYICLT